MRRSGLCIALATVFAFSAGLRATAQQNPAKYIYDPLTGTSKPNDKPLMVGVEGSPEGDPEVAPPKLESFTLEALVRPAAEQQTAGGDVLPIVELRGADGSLAQINVTRSRPPHSYNWLQGAAAPAGGKRVDLARNRYNGVTHVRDKTENPCRHLAIVYDAASQRATYYVDYRPADSVKLDKPLTLVQATLSTAPHKDGKAFAGMVDARRLTPKALAPWDFLRASPHDLKNVSFKPSDKPLIPHDAGYVDVRLSYGALGDGAHDDTAAIQRAMNDLAGRIPVEYNTLYFPAGTYLVSDTVSWSRYLMLQGEGPGNSVIKLADKAPGFGEARKPKPVVKCSNWDGKGRGSGSAMQNYAYDLAIDTGKGNAGAIGFQYHTNNRGRIENVVIRSGDGSGAVGLDLTLKWVGPCLIKHVTVEGFDVGVLTANNEYSLVMEFLTLRGQKSAGLRNQSNICSMRKVSSENACPAIVNANASGMVVLLDSELTCKGAGAGPAIHNAGALYARNVQTKGYEPAILTVHTDKSGKETKREAIKAPTVGEYVAGQAYAAFGGKPASLNLPIEETPEAPIEPADKWVNVLSFADKAVGDDWGPALQAAIDSGAVTLYVPANTTLKVKTPIEVRGEVRRLFGLHSGISGDENALGSKPALSVATDGEPVVFDRFVIGGGKGNRSTDKLGSVALEHTGKRAVAIKSCGLGGYRTAGGVGPLFIEDSTGQWVFENGQTIWGRHMNPEARQPEVEIVNRGCKLWILGLKTEYESINIVNVDGAKTEVLGGLIYPVGNVPPELPMFVNENSSFSVVIAESIYTKNHKIIVKDTQGSNTEEFTQLDWGGGRPKINLYVSRPPQ